MSVEQRSQHEHALDAVRWIWNWASLKPQQDPIPGLDPTMLFSVISYRADTRKTPVTAKARYMPGVAFCARVGNSDLFEFTMCQSSTAILIFDNNGFSGETYEDLLLVEGMNADGYSDWFDCATFAESVVVAENVASVMARIARSVLMRKQKFDNETKQDRMDEILHQMLKQHVV